MFIVVGTYVYDNGFLVMCEMVVKLFCIWKVMENDHAIKKCLCPQNH